MTFATRISVLVLVAGVLPGLAFEAVADTLYRDKQPVKIGLGKQSQSKIEWTDCSSTKRESFNEPPYSLDRADNCSVGPPTFGLQCNGASCRVIDEAKLQKYLPAVRNGEPVRLRIQEHSVELESTRGVLRLER